MRACWSLENSSTIASSPEWLQKETSLACLSVRSGFDALLHALNFEPESEILVSAITIRGMTQIIEAYGLVPIPLDLDMRHLSVLQESLSKAVTPRTKAILVAHLFGSRMKMESILEFARSHQLLVIEDCAQAYTGTDYRGHPQSDISLFSFGSIKTATALGGGVLHFRDASLCQAVRDRQEQWPIQSQQQFCFRLCKYALLMMLSYRATYTVFTGVCQMMGIDCDRLISNSVRGFSSDDFFARIRQRPCSALLALLARRLQCFNRERIRQRTKLAEQAIALIPSYERPGSEASEHTHWVFPILCPDPERLMRHLWDRGFDATRGGSSLYVVEAPENRPEMTPTEAKRAFQQLLYLPIYTGVSLPEIERLARALNDIH
ncbi:MAG: DegT/DnrJ/EryC1/StrS family aminotransferase [Cyanobacteria bacterium SBLK]|nr:DegT/DnrJ/EryC1/StrS family aminotransferase [Cyanobacteria bacterium SBLK]